MTEEPKIKRELFGKICGCEFFLVTTPDDKTHFESDCLDKAARAKVAAAFEEEAILRVKPAAPAAPPAEPLALVTES